MSLRRKILLKDAVLLVGLLAMVGDCLWGLQRQRQHVRASLDELSALHWVELAQAQLTAYQQSVHAGRMSDPGALDDLRGASADLRRYKAIVSQYDAVLPPEISADLRALLRTRTKSLVTGVVHLVTLADPPPNRPPIPAADPVVVAAQVDQLARDVGALLAVCNGFVHKTELTSEQDLRTATVGVSGVAVIALLGSVLASLWQHRRMTVPLDRLAAWCRRTAGGDFSVPFQPSGDREFQNLARDVNRMAADLDAFYRRLEGMVAAKSRELVRSERLASIGYLAAGVAHEINTPLNVMSGYAELSLRRLGRDEPAADGDLTEHLSIIRGEAFRCKQITAKLLSLARGDGDARSAVDVSAAVEDVAGMVRGLKAFRGKRLVVTPSVPPPPVVWANGTEVKQVLLNLIVNAVEAVPVDTGEVTVSATAVDGWVEVVVSDNGRGMTEQVRAQVFEPFFTDKRGAAEPGTGLGLSITHTIVADHGGRIEAHSGGPGKGSRFTVRLPAAAPVEVTA